MGKNTVSVMNRMTLMEQLKMYWKFFFEKGEKVPRGELPKERVNLDRLYIAEGGLRASWLGHSSLLINIDGYTVLTDPVFSRKVSPVGPVRFNREIPLQIDELPKVDVVIVSHNHYDHLNKYSIQKLIPKTGKFVVPLKVGKLLQRWGVRPEQIIELDWWQECRVNDDLTVVATPSRHFSGRGLLDRNKTLWASWVVQTAKHNLFFSGDSGYFRGFLEIGRKYGPFDVAFVECGAYNERWPNVHMFPEQTVQAFLDLGGKLLQPVHWASFNLALHPWYEPVERLIAEAWNKDVMVSTPPLGRVVDYEKAVPQELWWLPAMEQSRYDMFGLGSGEAMGSPFSLPR